MSKQYPLRVLLESPRPAASGQRRPGCRRQSFASRRCVFFSVGMCVSVTVPAAKEKGVNISVWVQYMAVMTDNAEMGIQGAG